MIPSSVLTCQRETVAQSKCSVRDISGKLRLIYGEGNAMHKASPTQISGAIGAQMHTFTANYRPVSSCI